MQGSDWRRVGAVTTVPAKAVCDAVLDAIVRDVGETHLTAGWLRPMLPILRLFPATGPRLMRLTGVRAPAGRRGAAAYRRDDT